MCLLDADKLPSDQPFSTHAIGPLGVEFLDELGVGDRIRAVTPRTKVARIAVGDSFLDLDIPERPGMYSPRRSVLDAILQEAAVSAGAELRDETSVLDVLRDGDRVVGVRARTGDTTHEVRARTVVGADGRNSTIAKKVNSRAYHESHVARGGYWSYFPATRDFDALPYQSFIDIQGTRAAFAFRTDHDLVITGALDEPSVAKTWAKDPAPHVTERLRASPVFGSLMANAPVAPFVGLLSAHFYFREPVGPGWALVGDAALHKDPTPGYGITDALRDAKALASALLDGREAALEHYWRKRDVVSVPFYENALAMGAIDYDNPLNRTIVRRANASAELRARMLETVYRTRSPFDVVSPLRILGWVGSELLHGHAGVWPAFKVAAERGTRVKKELELRQKLLSEAEAKLAREAPRPRAG